MTPSSKIWGSAGLALTVVLACSSTGVELGKNPGNGGSDSGSGGHASTASGGTTAHDTGGTTHDTGGTTHDTGGTTHDTGGTTHDTGGTTHDTGGTTHDTGGTANPGTGGSPDCSVIGCGLPPICGESCGAPCGCCGCAPNDFTEVNGSAYQCAGNCYSPAHYGYADLATGAFRFAIFKKDEHRNLCFRIIMGTMSHAPLHIVTSTPLVVEAAYRTTNAADCDSVLPVAPDGALVPADAMGHVFASRDAKGVCTLDLDVTLYLSGSDPIATETLRSPPIALPDLACQ